MMAFARHGIRRGGAAVVVATTLPPSTKSTIASSSSRATARIRRRVHLPPDSRSRQRQPPPWLRTAVARPIVASMSSSSRLDVGNNRDVNPGGRSSLMSAASAAAVVAASIALATFALPSSSSMSSSSTGSMRRSAICESASHLPPTRNDDDDVRPETAGEDDKDDDAGGDGDVVIRDGMDAGVVAVPPTSSSSSSSSSSGPANAEEEDEDEDGGEDEETTCSICLINRQGPCRKYWLKFERCMKEHGREKEERTRRMRGRSRRKGEDDDGGGGAGPRGIATKNVDAMREGDHDARNSEWPTRAMMEEEWDAFMEKSTTPGEDDEDEEEDDEEDGGGDNDEEGDDDTDDAEMEPAVMVGDISDGHNEHEDDDDDDNSSLAEQCDRFMIPWIGCIQEHRNAYTLISNAFYRDDMIDPLESTIRDDKRLPYPLTTSGNVLDVDEIDEVVRGYVVVKYHGVEIDLGNWKEHVDADYDDDVDDGDGKDVVDAKKVVLPPSISAEPHLINALARFRLVDPDDGNRPIEVAYIKDQNGRVLGFDSFAKAKQREEGVKEDADAAASDDRETAEALSSKEGECTFHIVPGETTSIVAYAIYRGTARNEDGTGGGDGDREDVLYYTPDIHLPKGGAANAKKSR